MRLYNTKNSLEIPEIDIGKNQWIHETYLNDVYLECIRLSIL